MESPLQPPFSWGDVLGECRNLSLWQLTPHHYFEKRFHFQCLNLERMTQLRELGRSRAFPIRKATPPSATLINCQMFPLQPPEAFRHPHPHPQGIHAFGVG